MGRGKRAVVVGLTLGVLAVGGTAVATYGFRVDAGNGGAALSCPGGMSRLGHVFDENASVFPGDPPVDIEIATTIEADGFLVERVTTGVHTGTHIDAPGHFIAGGRTVDELDATEFVWPAYVIDVRDRMAATEDDGFQLTVADIRAYERANGRIRPKSMVIIRTGFDELYGTPEYVTAATPGFAGDTVQWLVDNRNIGGVGSDTLGPDATSDADFLATYTILANDRVALPDIDNLASLSIRDDVIIASAVPLRDGSGFMTDPLACHGRRGRG
jgi:kynurenine formamidase